MQHGNPGWSNTAVRLACVIAGTGYLAAGSMPAITPVWVINIASCAVGTRQVGFRINDFSVGPSGIYAVVTPGRYGSPSLTKLDLHGGCVASISLPAQTGNYLAVDSTGTIVVNDFTVSSGVPRQGLLMFDGSTLKPKGTFVTTREVFPFASIAGALYGVDRRAKTIVKLRLVNSSADIDAAPAYNVPLDALGRYSLAVVGNSLVVFEEGSHRLTRLDVTTGKSSRGVVSTPELDKTLAAIPAALRPSSLDPRDKTRRVFAVSVIAVGASASGTVYLELSRFDPKQGPRMLALPKNGPPVAFVCHPPGGAGFTPAALRLGCYGKNLYLVDPLAGTMAVYDLSAARFDVL